MSVEIQLLKLMFHFISLGDLNSWFKCFIRIMICRIDIVIFHFIWVSRKHLLIQSQQWIHQSEICLNLTMKALGRRY